MAAIPATVTYLIAEPFQEALKSLRRILSARHLEIAGGFDVSARIRKKLFIGTNPCIVLFVSPPRSLGAALEADHCAAAIAPFHVVVSERGRQTEIHVLRTLSGDSRTLEPLSLAALNEAHSEILRAIESIAMPAAMGA
jgi:uncharacterized protein (DUF302 family)